MRAEFKHRGFTFVFEKELLTITTPDGGVVRSIGVRGAPGSEYMAIARGYVLGYEHRKEDQPYGA